MALYNNLIFDSSNPSIVLTLDCIYLLIVITPSELFIAFLNLLTYFSSQSLFTQSLCKCKETFFPNFFTKNGNCHGACSTTILSYSSFSISSEILLKDIGVSLGKSVNTLHLILSFRVLLLYG